ncbi:myb-like protein X [Cydia fagiglandana]|uniref:myb-like protein X n=1 Tax=Cydia fagiglandana TaxID=1458189 RepID=UPI002FEDE8FD
MQYVSGKNDDVPLKTSGHIRNSLRRKKRSLNLVLDNIRSNSAPEILHYETRHGPREREPLLPIHKLTQNKIQSANLADFNIETLHEPAGNLEANKKESWRDNIQLSQKHQPPKDESDDSREKGDNLEERKPYNGERDDNLGEGKSYNDERDDNSGERKPYISERDDNSGERKPYISERDDNSGEKQSYVNDASDESIETNNDAGRERTHDSHTRSPENSNESLESEDLKLPSKDVDRKENQESNESNEDSNRNSKHVAAHARNIDSEEVNDNSDERDSPQEKNSKISRNYDESNEENEKPKHEPKQLNFDASDKTAPKGIQDVDLGDFSYERIQVGKDGKVELAKDIYGKDDDSGEEKPLNDKIIIKETEPPQSEYIEKVNNDEIKPVIELNTESNSNEYSDENVDTDIKQPQKAQLNSDDAGVEDLSDAKENDSGEKSDKQIAQNNEQQNGNVKQQFERIPLNYKHDKKTENTENNKKENETPTDDSQNEKDGTLDTLIPKEERYDEKLNFKFDDVSIKLPDIKLPEDILSYNYESSPYKKRNKKKRKNKNRFYHYSDEHSDEFPKEISIPQYDDDDDRGYYKYDDPYEKKQDYKKKPAQDDDEDDEGVDLYEKFVRERFGKRGSFEKRSEALRNEVFRPSDPKLSETIQHILKKSAANLKQAEKSGDPKAGYMWTLEYGQNL